MSKQGIIILILSFVLVIGSFIGLKIHLNYNEEIITITVKDKERVHSEYNSKYLVWDTEGNVYQVTDALLRLQFDSSDRYGYLIIGEEYEITVVGARVRVLSWYKNIVKIN